ncbi:hypothetical protein B0H34DRAFT_699011 [Crassisporium funariophilum]|nr:hypothetical protein B0H34DRAFT_699011 [Crassisporium funariophilum]
MAISRDRLWDSGHDETVEVNQRALIDKVLARYSGEFTVFRELLQNSDDAQSKAVEIRFERESFLDRPADKVDGERNSGMLDIPLPNLKTTQVHRWTFKNNGILFRDEDWNRLKKIAEGNPDEEKIGAFGVGFYSLFSVTEEPFVTSGDQWMGFYWKDKKDQLFARRGQLPDDDKYQATKSWTSFEMKLREPAPIPVAFDFTRFLVSSLTFMRHLCEVSVYFDDKQLVRLTKSTGIPRDLGVPKNLNNRSPSGTMIVDNIQSTPLCIQAQVMKWVYTSGTEKKRAILPTKPTKQTGGGFFSSVFQSFSGYSTPQRMTTPSLPPEPEVSDPLSIYDTSVSLSIFSASVQVQLNKKIASEIHRSTKKNPPIRMKYELIYTAKDEYDASREEDKKQPEATGSIFQGLRADLDGIGAARVFIGHSTAQTTGIGGHMAGRFIPTVERESIDFMDRNVAIWNKELLYVGGLLARSAYELELAKIEEQWGSQSSGISPPSHDIQLRLTSQVLHALKFFMFFPSTPSPEVSSIMEAAFFSCSLNGNFSIMTNKGIRNSKDVRLPDLTFSGFLKNLPTLSDEILVGAGSTISSLQRQGMIKAITFSDVLQELQSRPLNEDELIACLKWWIKVYGEAGDRDPLIPIRNQLLNAIILAYEPSSHGSIQKILPLSTIKFYINPKTLSGSIPSDGPLPEYLLPLAISKSFKPEVLAASFPWTEFSLVQWLSYICDSTTIKASVEFDINTSPPWAERVLGLLARAWPSLSIRLKEEVHEILRERSCIPTSSGMKIPQQAYFSNVNIFRDLPVVTLPSGAAVKGTFERMLQELGVRKHVELQIIFNRMIKTNEWTIADLTKYLVSVKGTLTPEELQRLKATSAFPKEMNLDPDAKRPRYFAKELFEPLDTFRTLGLPVIDWGQQTKWRSSSEEAKFLFDLGLLRFPPLDMLITLCANEDANIRSVALKYLVDNVDSRYQDYDPKKFKTIRFIPALQGSTTCLGSIEEVVSSPDWAHMGFLILHPSHHSSASKLKVKDHPHASQLVSLLETKPPGNEAEAKIWFQLLSSRVNDFANPVLRRLSDVSFVPVKTEKGVAGPSMRWLKPTQCYLAGETNESFHSKLFTFVDFGSGGNAFLVACGTKNQPSVEEVAIILLANPHQFYELAQGPNNFLAELRNIAVNIKAISTGTITRMKRSPILLGSQRKPRHSEKKNIDDLDEDEWDTIYDLKKAEQIIIADDTHAYQAFGDSLFTAPQEDILENFYGSLGSRRLSHIIREEYTTTGELQNAKIAIETRSLILERLPLFLHEHTHTQTRVSFSWLSASNNFIVKSFGKLGVVKYLNHGELRLSRKQDASAVAQRVGSGPIQLWIAGNSQIDMYEVSISLNRLLFESPKANDALLFMTILSTDLRSLKRRGYNVDRILRQQREARLAAENTKLKQEQDIRLASHSAQADVSKSSTARTHEVTLDGVNPPEVNNVASKPNPATVFSNTLQNLRRKIGNKEKQATPSEQESLLQPVDRNPVDNLNSSPTSNPVAADTATRERPMTKSPHAPNRGGNSNPAATSLSHISNNIDMAINACRSESANVLSNREHMQEVKESLNEGYCDISGRTGNLRNIGQMGSVKVYLSQDVPLTQASNFMEIKRDSIARFIHVITSLARIYELPLTSIHIFYDLEGGLIAFNRNGSLFLNLRYFEEWHDADVSKNILDSAYVSWYFTLAHEIAHNLVQPHNSEHEFYFSAICEKYIIQFGQLLATRR